MKLIPWKRKDRSDTPSDLVPSEGLQPLWTDFERSFDEFFDDSRTELYSLADDPSEQHDIADRLHRLTGE